MCAQESSEQGRGPGPGPGPAMLLVNQTSVLTPSQPVIVIQDTFMHMVLWFCFFSLQDSFLCHLPRDDLRIHPSTFLSLP